MGSCNHTKERDRSGFGGDQIRRLKCSTISPFFPHSYHLPSRSPASKSLERACLLLSEGPLYFKAQCWEGGSFIYCREILLSPRVSMKKLLLPSVEERLMAALSPSFWPLAFSGAGFPQSSVLFPVSMWESTPESSRVRCRGPSASVSPVGD